MMYTPRPYQQKAIDAVFDEWQRHSSTMLVLPTGTGKTVVLSGIARRAYPARTLVIAHREELVQQAESHLNRVGLATEVEMADRRASAFSWNEAPALVASVQTLTSGRKAKRMERFLPEDFGLLIIDECHHATASTYRQIVKYFQRNPDLKVLGVTATPDRADEQALGQIFESCAYDYEILDAITDGWLVPVAQQMVHIEGLDFSKCRTTAGDLNGADLAAVMEAEKPLHGIASATIDIIGNDKRTLVFTVSVKQAEMLAEIFNRHREGMADFICGATPKEKRQGIFQKFSTGQTQVLVNVGVATEGYDNPAVEVIVQARPTKSRSLYAQIIGRGLRPLSGTVDGIDEAADRRLAIEHSPKPTALILDFAGNAGRHQLVTTADILGGKVSSAARARAIADAEASGKAVRMDQALEDAENKIQMELEAARQREAARKAHLIAQATYSTQAVSPFDVFGLKPRESGFQRNNRTLSDKQRSLLLKQGINPDKLQPGQAQAVLNEMFRRWNDGLASYRQCATLKRYGYETKDLTKDAASKLIDQLAKNGWRQVA